MHKETDEDAFWTAMERLSIALSLTMTAERVAVYFDALCDLRLEDVAYACQHAARHWQASEHERNFPTPARLREFALMNRDNRVKQSTADAHAEAKRAERAMLAQWSETPDQVGLDAIRKIRKALGESMEMTHPVYREPSTDDPEKRKAELREQARWILHGNGQEEE